MSDCSSPEASASVNILGDDESTFKILVATDCHLGYKQRANEQIQCNDSFDTFEEILQMAVDEEVDFILLGGDLFHDSKPSQTVVLRCMNLLKTYCLGPNKIKFQFLTDPLEVLSSSDKLNFEDTNLSISMPIFTIHGNHDNPSFDYTSTLDILVTSGFVNYFGKLTDLNELTVVPMVFKKGKTTVAIYGISYIGEQRLSRCFSQERVKFMMPEDGEDAFNILVIHQNRARHTVHGHVPDDKLPSFFDLIFWGHEHECRIIPEEIFVEDGSYHVMQPGSSVATSLCEGESKTKKAGILRIKKKNFQVEPKKLQTVRPFIHRTLSVKELTDNDFCVPNADGVCEYVEDYLNKTIFPEIEAMYTGHPKQPKLPLIRLKVMCHDDSLKFDTMEITRKFCDRVANPRDIVLFRKEKSDTVNYDEDEDPAIALAQCFQHNDAEHIWSFTVQRGIEKYFQTSNERLKMLSLLGLTEALNSTTDANDDEAFPNIVSHQISKITEFLQDRQFEFNEESFREEIKKFHEARAAIPEKEVIAEVKRMLQASQTQPRATAAAAATANDDDEDQGDTPPARGRGRGRGSRARAPRAPRGSRAGRTTTRGRGSTSTLDVSTAASSTSAAESTQDSSRVRFTQRSVQSSRAPATQTQASQFVVPSDSDSD